MSAGPHISGNRVLIVEDESLVSMMIVDVLEDMGFEIAAVVGSLNEGLAKAREESFDLAILDLNLDGQRSDAIAEVLRGRKCPFLIATGYGAAGLPEHLQGTPTLAKPFGSRDMERAVSAVLGRIDSQKKQ